MTHFTDLEIERWRTSGPGADRERIVAHVAECAVCAASYAEAIRTRPLEGESPADAHDFVNAGYGVPRPKARWTWAVPLAAAAGILIVLLVLPRWVNHENTPSTMTFRGDSIQALTPQGPVDPSTIVFTWSSGISTGRFKLQVGSASGVIYSVETNQSRLEAPQPLRQLLQAGGDFWWSVAVLDASGKTLVESQRRTFTIKPLR